MASILTRYGTWIACCLSRGRQAPIGGRELAELADELGEESFAGGTFVFRQGDDAARVHIVRSGAVELSRLVHNRRVTLQILESGDVFGDVPAFLGDAEPFDARALEDSTILSLDVDALFDLLQTRPRVARRWFISLAERMQGLQERLGDLLAGSIESQLASILLREADGGSSVAMSQAQLASMLGIQRTSAQRVLKSLEGSGLIALHYRRVELVDSSGLRGLLDGGG
jgi:CRP-like cAMP-binding protein